MYSIKYFWKKSCINFSNNCEIQFCQVIKQNISWGGASRESKCKARLSPPSSPRPSALWQKCLHRILNTPERTRKKEWYCGEHKYYKGKRTNEDDCKGNAHLPRDLKLVQVQKAANFSFFQRTSRILPWQEKKQSPESSPPGKKGKCKLLKTLRNRRRAAICRMLRKRLYLLDAFS